MADKPCRWVFPYGDGQIGYCAIHGGGSAGEHCPKRPDLDSYIVRRKLRGAKRRGA